MVNIVGTSSHESIRVMAASAKPQTRWSYAACREHDERLDDRDQAEERRRCDRYQDDRSGRILLDVVRADLPGSETAHPQVNRHQKEGHAAVPADQHAADQRADAAGTKEEDADADGQSDPEPQVPRSGHSSRAHAMAFRASAGGLSIAAVCIM